MVSRRRLDTRSWATRMARRVGRPRRGRAITGDPGGSPGFEVRLDDQGLAPRPPYLRLPGRSCTARAPPRRVGCSDEQRVRARLVPGRHASGHDHPPGQPSVSGERFRGGRGGGRGGRGDAAGPPVGLLLCRLRPVGQPVRHRRPQSRLSLRLLPCGGSTNPLRTSPDTWTGASTTCSPPGPWKSRSGWRTASWPR